MRRRIALTAAMVVAAGLLPAARAAPEPGSPDGGGGGSESAAADPGMKLESLLSSGKITQQALRAALVDVLAASGAVVPPRAFWNATTDSVQASAASGPPGLEVPGGWLSGGGNLDGAPGEDVLAFDFSIQPMTVRGLRGSDGGHLWSYAPPDPLGIVFAFPDLELDQAPGDDLVVGSIAFHFQCRPGGACRIWINTSLAGLSGATGTVLWENTYNNETGSFTPPGGSPTQYSINLAFPAGVSQDLDGDTLPDLLLARVHQLRPHFGVTTFEVVNLRTGLPTSLIDAGGLSPFARIVPDMNGDGVDDVVTIGSAAGGIELRARTGRGAFLWNRVVAGATLVSPGVALDPDGRGDLIVAVPSATSLETTFVAISGADGATKWEASLAAHAVWPGMVVFPDPTGGAGQDVLLLGIGDGNHVGFAMVDGPTGERLWHRVSRGGFMLAGDASGDGVPDLLVFPCPAEGDCGPPFPGPCPATGGGCGSPSPRELWSGRDGSVVWTRPVPAEGYETLVAADGGRPLLIFSASLLESDPTGGDLDGDGAADLLMAHTRPGGTTDYTALSGRDGSELWPARQVFNFGPLWFTLVEDLRPDVPGADLLENFNAQGHENGLAARPGGGGPPLWTFVPGSIPGSDPFTVSGTIDAFNPSSAVVGGVTENEFVATCRVPRSTQGLDGYVVELPGLFATGDATASVTGSNALDLYDLDLAFYTADCRFIDQSTSAEPDEVAGVPAATGFIVVNASAGVETAFELTVTATPAPSPSPSPSSTVTPAPSPRECGGYPAVPNDPYFGAPDARILDPQQWAPKVIEAPAAWGVGDSTGCGITIAVIDTGIDLDHEDFQCAGKLAPGAAVIDGQIHRGERADDIAGHGTHVAGIIGACTDNGIGTVGVAPDATLMPYRVFTTEQEGDGSVNDIAVAIRDATDAGAHVVNMSLGIGIAGVPGTGAIGYVPGLLPEIDAAIDYARSHGAVVVAAAGNASLPLCEYPAIYEDVICVGATDPRDVKSWYSTFPVKTDEQDIIGPALVAPGGTGQVFCDVHSEEILSLYPQELDRCNDGLAGYRDLNGTSMAAPHVSGVAALVYERLGAGRNVTNAQAVIDAIVDNTDDLGAPGYDPVFGAGRVNALKAVQAVSLEPDPTPSPTPSESATPDPTPTETASPTPTDSPSPSPSESPELETAPVTFTERSAESGQYSDEALFEARLTDSNGDPIAGQELTFELTGAESSRGFSATTDEDGVASVTPTLEEKPGPHQLTVRFSGDEDHAGDADTVSFVVDKEDTALELSVEGEDDDKTLRARLSDLDTPSEGIAQRTIHFYSDGELIGSHQTNADGVASVALPPRHRGNNRTYEAVFEGDDFYLGSSDERAGKGKGKGGNGGGSGGNGGGGEGGRTYAGRMLLM